MRCGIKTNQSCRQACIHWKTNCGSFPKGQHGSTRISLSKQVIVKPGIDKKTKEELQKKFYAVIM